MSFPYDPIHKDDGNFFNSVRDLIKEGYAKEQIWAVIINDDYNSVTYTNDLRSVVNVLGYVASKQHVDKPEHHTEKI